MKHRLDALRAGLRAHDLDAYASLSPPANAYLTGFRGSVSAVVVTLDEAQLLCDFRYAEVAAEQVRACGHALVSGSFEAAAGAALEDWDAVSAGFDPAVTTVQQHGLLEAAFGGELVPLPEVLDDLRAVKDRDELDKIRAANDLAEEVLHAIKRELAPGVSEREVAARIVYEMQRRGAEKPAFDPIVLFGARSSLPHGVPGPKRLESGDIVLIDMGCQRDGYCSDLTRTYVFGTIPGAWFDEIYGVVAQAQLAALHALRPGVTGREADAAARDVIREAGYGECFGHGLGHGVGIEVHESIRLNARSNQVLAEGMVVTVEPGIYLPGKGGVRIEDLVVVTAGGYEVLTQSPKELEVIPV